MEIVSLADLTANINYDEVVEVEIHGHKVEVKQYLPVQKKLAIISAIVNSSLDPNDFYNPCKVEMFMSNYIVSEYTNIEVDKEDTYGVYDAIVKGDVLRRVRLEIPESELLFIESGVKETIESVYKYMNSAKGVMEDIANNYSGMDFDANQILNTLLNENSLPMLKELAPLINDAPLD